MNILSCTGGADFRRSRLAHLVIPSLTIEENLRAIVDREG